MNHKDIGEHRIPEIKKWISYALAQINRGIMNN